LNFLARVISSRVLALLFLLVYILLCNAGFMLDRIRHDRNLALHCDVIALDIWNFDTAGPIEYLTLAARYDAYAELHVELPDGRTLFDLHGERPGIFIQSLIDFGLMRYTRLSHEIRHSGQHLATLHVIRRVEVVISFAYLLLVMLLIYLALIMFLRVHRANIELKAASELLESRVAERTTELQSTVTRLAAAKQEVHGVTQHLESILDNAISLIYLKDLDGRYTQINRRFLEIFRLTEPDVLGKTDAELFEPEMARNLLAHDKRVIQMGQPQDFIEVMSVQGENRYYSSMKFPIRDQTGQLIALCGMSNDITDREVHFSALQASETRFRKFFEALGDAVFVTKAEGQDAGRILEANQAAARQTGYSREELLRMNILHDVVVQSPEGPNLKTIYDELLQGQELAFTEQKKRADGSLYWTEVTVTPIEYDGHRAGLSINHDITERHELEAQLRQSQKLEAIGRLAGGVAHDFNNMLAVINGYSELLGVKELDADASEYVQQIQEAGLRAAGLTGQLLAFSRKQVIQTQIIDVNALVRNYLKMLGRLLGEDIELVTRLEPDIPVIEMDPGQLEQVIMNSAINARDAMLEGGRLILASSRLELGADEAANLDLPAGEYVSLKVIDNGSGMSKDTLAHIFEPFFTTKGVNKGTGLGLSTVYGIIKQSGGHVRVTSEQNHGSTFEFLIPAASGDKLLQADESVSEQALSGHERVLLAEDDPAVRRVIVRVLESHGYKVQSCENGKEALKVYHENPGAFDLLLTDVVMPRMGGRVLVERIREIDPKLKVIFVTGYMDSNLDEDSIKTGDVLFVQKPFSTEGLLKMMRRALDAC
jgi:two-component system cell cycle sensor histidine kinase/response regulator CckA